MGPIELALVAGTPAATMLAKDLLFKILGPSAEYLGEKLKGNLVAVAGKAQTMMEEAGIDPAQVHPRIGVPLLESARLEDDPDMQERWAALLANAANADGHTEVPPSFPEILKQLSSKEAKLLDAVFDAVCSQLLHSPYPLHVSQASRVTFGHRRLAQMFVNLGLTGVPWAESLADANAIGQEALQDQSADIDSTLHLLLRHRLLEARQRLDMDTLRRLSDGLVRDSHDMKYRGEYCLTTIGYEFVTACRRPKKKKG